MVFGQMNNTYKISEICQFAPIPLPDQNSFQLLLQILQRRIHFCAFTVGVFLLKRSSYNIGLSCFVHVMTDNHGGKPCERCAAIFFESVGCFRVYFSSCGTHSFPVLVKLACVPFNMTRSCAVFMT